VALGQRRDARQAEPNLREVDRLGRGRFEGRTESVERGDRSDQAHQRGAGPERKQLPSASRVADLGADIDPDRVEARVTHERADREALVDRKLDAAAQHEEAELREHALETVALGDEQETVRAAGDVEEGTHTALRVAPRGPSEAAFVGGRILRELPAKEVGGVVTADGDTGEGRNPRVQSASGWGHLESNAPVQCATSPAPGTTCAATGFLAHSSDASRNRTRARRAATRRSRRRAPGCREGQDRSARDRRTVRAGADALRGLGARRPLRRLLIVVKPESTGPALRGAES